VKGSDLARVRGDLERRRLAPGDTAAERNRRGRALVDAALRGDPPPGEAAKHTEAPRVETTACVRCYRPHEAPPGSVCASCADPPPLDLSSL